LNVHTVKPLDIDAVLQVARSVKTLITVEEHVRTGGLGSAVSETLTDRLDGRIPILRRLAIPDVFPKEYGSQDTMLETFGLQPKQIAAAVQTAIRAGAASI
jgi:transketolase